MEMVKIDEEERKKLEKMIKLGKWNYVLIYGSRYALFMFLFSWFFTKFIFEEEFYVGLHMILWGIAGLIIGLWGWRTINKKIRRK